MVRRWRLKISPADSSGLCLEGRWRMLSLSCGEFLPPRYALLFDISGAFDNVWLSFVLNNLKDRNCSRNVFEVLRNYFRDRNVQIELGHEIISKKTTRRCPQGSVLDPACWNIMLDGLLRRLKRVIPIRSICRRSDSHG